VVIAEDSNRITHLIVGHGLLQRDEHVIPISTVEKVASEEIQVSILAKDLADYPKYTEVEVEEPLDDWESDTVEPHEEIYFWYPTTGVHVRYGSTRPVSHRRIVKGVPAGEAIIGPATAIRNKCGVVGKVDHLRLNPESWEVTEFAVHRGLIPQHLVVPLSEITDVSPEEVSTRGENEEVFEVSTV
jgi:sporulation protein YlmC with PRC-barrel domain